MCQHTTADLVFPANSPAKRGLVREADSPSASLDALKQPHIAPDTDGDDLAHPLGLQSRWQRRLHLGRQSIRRSVVGALFTNGDAGLARRAWRIGSCGAMPMASISSSGSVTLHPALCRDRLCPTCGRSRSFTLAAKTQRLVSTIDSLRLVTLTLRASDATLTDQLAKLRSCWKRLRRTKFWRERVDGGVYGVEVKLGRDSGSWHVHLHALVAGDFIDQRTLSAIWEELTTDSPIVDVRFVHSKRDAAKYVAAYVTKGSGVGDWSDEQICEFATAMHGQRLLQTFGVLHGVNLDADADDNRDFGARSAVDLVPLRAAAKKGCDAARLVCAAIAELEPEVGAVLCDGLDLSEARHAFQWVSPLQLLRAPGRLHGWYYPPPPPVEPATLDPSPRPPMNRAARRQHDANRQAVFRDAGVSWRATNPHA